MAAFKVKAKTYGEFTENVRELGELAASLLALVKRTNEKTAEIFDELAEAKDDYNEKLEEVRSTAIEVYEGAYSAFERKSEKWTASEVGQATQEWLNVWSGFAEGLGDFSMTTPEDVDYSIPDLSIPEQEPDAVSEEE